MTTFVTCCQCHLGSLGIRPIAGGIFYVHRYTLHTYIFTFHACPRIKGTSRPVVDHILIRSQKSAVSSCTIIAQGATSSGVLFSDYNVRMLGTSKVIKSVPGTIVPGTGSNYCALLR
jgi:hypothetical protein